MKTRIGVLTVLCCIWCIPGPAQQDDPQLLDAMTRFYRAIEEGNALARVDLLDEEVILMPNGAAAIRGKTAVARIFTADTATSVFRIKDRTPVELSISGNLAYTVNSYWYTWHKRGGEPTWRKTKNVHVWRKDREGRWKLHLDIWNSDEPIMFR